MKNYASHFQQTLVTLAWKENFATKTNMVNHYDWPMLNTTVNSLQDNTDEYKEMK